MTIIPAISGLANPSILRRITAYLWRSGNASRAVWSAIELALCSNFCLQFGQCLLDLARSKVAAANSDVCAYDQYKGFPKRGTAKW